MPGAGPYWLTNPAFSVSFSTIHSLFRIHSRNQHRPKLNFSRFCKLIFRTFKRNILRIICLDIFGHHQNIVKVNISDISVPILVYMMLILCPTSCYLLLFAGISPGECQIYRLTLTKCWHWLPFHTGCGEEGEICSNFSSKLLALVVTIT